MIDNTARLPELMSQLAELVTEFERLAPGRSFTPDGHLVGSIGELIAKSEHGLELAPASTKGYDATRITTEGEARTVEIKATQGASVALRHIQAPCDDLIVLTLNLRKGTWRTVYDGPAAPVWDLLPSRMQSNGTRTIALSKLRSLPHGTPLQSAGVQ